MEEKRLKFTELYISNFRNITEMNVKFNDGMTKIEGENGLGKTNTLSAIMWCLFGKDIYDVKQFPISPIINGTEDNNLTTTVRLVINDNYVIERNWYQRKATIKTGWIIDGKTELVALTQTKYNEELKEHFVDEETFKSLSNINYIPNLNWKDLKQLIFGLIGNIEDDEVLLRDDFKLIEEYVKKFGIDETQRLLKQTDTELNDDIKRLETEYQTLLNTKDKYVASEEDNSQLIARKEEINKKLDEVSSIQEESKKRQEELLEKQTHLKQIENEIARLNMSITTYEEQIKDYEELYNNSGMSEDQLREKDRLDIESVKSNLNKAKEEFEISIHNLELEIESLKTEGNILKAKEVKVENDTCSSCGQHLPENKIQETLNKLKEEHNNKLLEIKNRLEDKKTTLEQQKNELGKVNDLIDEKEKELDELPNKKYEIQNETEKQKEIRVRKEQREIELKQTKETLPKFLDEKEKLQKEIGSMVQVNVEEIDITSLKQELEEINEKLATTITLNKLNDDVDAKLKELEEKRNNKVVNKDKLLEVVKFNNIKADLLQKRVRQYFNVVNFRTKEFNQSGEEVETFKICNDKGVEWKDINSGHKILLGVDLLQGIMKAKNVYVPMVIDNFESLTNDINIEDTQLIVASAIKGKKDIEVI